jgi:hypothetical protein
MYDCWQVETQQQQRMQVLATNLRTDEHNVANGAVIFLTLEMFFFVNWKYVCSAMKPCAIFIGACALLVVRNRM